MPFYWGSFDSRQNKMTGTIEFKNEHGDVISKVDIKDDTAVRIGDAGVIERMVSLIPKMADGKLSS